MDRGAGAQAVSGRPRPGRARRPAGLRQRLGGRAPFPRGVLALVGAGGVPRRLLAAHQADPPRPRHRPDAARLQPPGARRRTHRHPRSRLERPRRVRHRRELGLGGAGRLWRAGSRQASGLARGGRAVRQHPCDGPLSRVRGPVLLDAGAQPGAEAGAKAAPAALGRLLQPRDDQAGRQARHRRAHLRLRRSDRGHAVGRGLLPDLQGRVRADRPCGEPQHLHGLLVRRSPRRRGGAAQIPGRLPLLPVRARLALRLRRAGARAHQHLGPFPDRAGQPRRHAWGAGRHRGRRGGRHRHTRPAARAPAQVRLRRRRPGGVHPAGRPQPA